MLRRVAVLCVAVLCAPAAFGAPPEAPEAARFLAQASFGPTEAGIAAVQKRGYAGWIDDQLAMPRPKTGYHAHVRKRIRALRGKESAVAATDRLFNEAFFAQAVTAPDQLRQRMTFALSQIFVVSMTLNDLNADTAASYYDTLAAHAFGDYRDLLEAVTRHPAMGQYLTYRGNMKEDAATGRQPDENYAREILQLMSIGLHELEPNGAPRADLTTGTLRPAYGQADVSGLARVFTGLSWTSPFAGRGAFYGYGLDSAAGSRPMTFYPEHHSTGEKAFLGVALPATEKPVPEETLKAALDRIAAHPNVGPFIAERLIQAFVTSNPSRDYVARAAAVFADDGTGRRGHLGAVLRAILLDPEARDPPQDPTFGKVREPVVRFTHWMRAFDARSQSGHWLITSPSSPEALAQSPLNAPSVFNFWRPGFVPGAGSELGSLGLRAPEMQVVDEVSVAGYINYMLAAVEIGVGLTGKGGARDVRARYGPDLALAHDPAALAARLDLLLFHGTMPAALRTQIEGAVASIAWPEGGPSREAEARRRRVQIAVALAMTSPDYLVLR